jgi:hypothetical protein
MKEEDDEEIYEIKLFFNKQEYDLSINSSYNETLGKISQILNLNANLLILSYDDEDGDNILVSNEEDYSIFLEQVKSNDVKCLIIELNDKSNENNINEYSNLNINEIKNINFDGNEKDNQFENINNINEINNYDLFNDNNIQNSNILKQVSNNDEEIEDKIYYFRCTSCDEYPILFVMFYCPECNLYLCENCGKNIGNHFHQLLKIDSQDKIYKIKEEENEKIEKNRIEKEKEKEKKSNNLLSIFHRLKHFKDGRMKTIRKKNNKIIGKTSNFD